MIKAVERKQHLAFGFIYFKGGESSGER